MKIIENLSEMITEEIEDAKKYAECAIKMQDEFPKVASLLHSLSLEEVGHANKLHDSVTDIIKEYRKEKGAPPVAMQAIYDYLHSKQILKMAEAKALQDMYKA